jgi:uncharacterized protein (DUF2141 family)
MSKWILPALLAMGATAAAGAATVEVRVAGVEGGRGSVHVAVCDKERFLKQCRYTASAPAQGGEMVLKVEGVPAGNWAVISFQDANQNGELDRNLLGIPSENYGFSRAARGRFGPPDFEAAALPVGEQPAVVNVKLK